MRGLNKIYYLKKEIRDLQLEIDTIPSVSAMNYSGMPHSTGVSDPTHNLALKREKLVDKLNKKQFKLLEEIERVEDVISTIDDVETRAIARKRFILNEKWEAIGEEMHIDRTACYRKLKNYIEFAHITQK